MNSNSLFDLPVGQSACVQDLMITGSMRRRLQDIGLIEGTRVECLQKKMCIRDSCTECGACASVCPVEAPVQG